MSTPRSPSDREVQEDLMRLEAYRNQLNALVQQHQYLNASLAEHRRARETLEGIEGTPEGARFLIPVGGETFVPGTADRASRVLIGVGSGVVAEFERPNASELLAQRITTIDRARTDLENQVTTLEERIEALSGRLEAIGRERSAPSSDVGRD